MNNKHFFSLVLVAIVTLTPTAFADINLSKIAFIESSNNPKAVGDQGKALGLFQLHYPLISDFNKANHTKYAHSDALDPITARKIAKWSLDTYFPKILSSRGIKPTISSILICWNAGCSKVSNPPKSTLKYIKKYKEIL